MDSPQNSSIVRPIGFDLCFTGEYLNSVDTFHSSYNQPVYGNFQPTGRQDYFGEDHTNGWRTQNNSLNYGGSLNMPSPNVFHSNSYLENPATINMQNMYQPQYQPQSVQQVQPYVQYSQNTTNYNPIRPPASGEFHYPNPNLNYRSPDAHDIYSRPNYQLAFNPDQNLGSNSAQVYSTGRMGIYPPVQFKSEPVNTVDQCVPSQQRREYNNNACKSQPEIICNPKCNNVSTPESTTINTHINGILPFATRSPDERGSNSSSTDFVQFNIQDHFKVMPQVELTLDTESRSNFSITPSPDIPATLTELPNPIPVFNCPVTLADKLKETRLKPIVTKIQNAELSEQLGSRIIRRKTTGTDLDLVGEITERISTRASSANSEDLTKKIEELLKTKVKVKPEHYNAEMIGKFQKRDSSIFRGDNKGDANVRLASETQSQNASNSNKYNSFPISPEPDGKSVPLDSQIPVASNRLVYSDPIQNKIISTNKPKPPVKPRIKPQTVFPPSRPLISKKPTARVVPISNTTTVSNETNNCSFPPNEDPIFQLQIQEIKTTNLQFQLISPLAVDENKLDKLKIVNTNKTLPLPPPPLPPPSLICLPLKVTDDKPRSNLLADIRRGKELKKVIPGMEFIKLSNSETTVEKKGKVRSPLETALFAFIESRRRTHKDSDSELDSEDDSTTEKGEEINWDEE